MLKREFLCQNHDEVLYELRQLQKHVKSKNMDKNYVNDKINEIKDTIRYCKKQGQSMENRLKKYFYAIVDLGFEKKERTK